MFSLSNYCLIYGYRLFLHFTQKSIDEKLMNIKNYENSTQIKNPNQLDTKDSKASNKITKRIIEYHQKTSLNDVSYTSTSSEFAKSNRYDSYSFNKAN
ncbi:hypothetical protein BCR36DRAFT_583179 [Piromyces finnis]|uniref:Uncharacterized protein n=1 Tax=Piromyces finnis TaxID=1754191 RepID=A0A1Y1VAN8_9FUNG|nr:hypothetical protein BCR36DRAFT_583177 [Piromyces finnis]ORX51134.1 hypothetical protein BCR36DRAFT_583179 [Piromyces finnis]|eukprot:ORX51130.1 hypothetical protein BCR36DRAFT_583177 [Piromyces finnis]